VDELASKVLKQVCDAELLAPGERVGVAVSGGADSVALLRLLLELRAELGIVLSVVHFNHKLRGEESEADASFVSALAAEHGLEFHLGSADTAKYAEENELSIETAARELRYDFFAGLMQEGETAATQSSAIVQPGAQRAAKLDKVATAHTLDDQAETVLMRVIRGTGTRGLGGIYPRLISEETDEAGEIVRPLLGVRRSELETYLRGAGQSWREDSSNRNLEHTRNRVRHLLLPLLEKEFNPAIRDGLSELADIARAEQDYWDNEAAGWMGTGVQWTVGLQAASNTLVQLGAAPTADGGSEEVNAAVELAWLLAEPLAVQRRVVRSIAEYGGFAMEFKHVEQVLALAGDDEGEGKQVELAQGWTALREQDTLVISNRKPSADATVGAGYEYRLAVPGSVEVAEVGWVFHAGRGLAGAVHGDGTWLDAAKVGTELKVRNWKPGDRFWPEHSKGPKKVKELLQEQGVKGEQKKNWPVVVKDGEIVWVKGFPAARGYGAAAGKAGIELRVTGAGT
jgi:tRNA(Ile)-lysidine synthase